jgi:hypothetical protein
VAACGVRVWGFGSEGHFGLFYGRARYHFLDHKGYPCVEKEGVKAKLTKNVYKQFLVIFGRRWSGSGSACADL